MFKMFKSHFEAELFEKNVINGHKYIIIAEIFWVTFPFNIN